MNFVVFIQNCSYILILISILSLFSRIFCTDIMQLIITTITITWFTGLLVLGSSRISTTSNAQLKIGTDDSWSLVYDSTRRPPQLVRIEIECPVETILSNRNFKKSKKSGYLIHWFKDDKKLSIFSRRVHVDDAFLTIKHANRFDSGVYYCEIITGAGSSLKSPKLSLELIDGMNFFLTKLFLS